MNEKMLTEFRERAEALVPLPDVNELAGRGRARRRVRQGIVGGAMAAAVVVAVLAAGGGGGEPRTEIQPEGEPTTTVPQWLGAVEGKLQPGSYLLDSLVPDGRPDASVELVGTGWNDWDSGAYKGDPEGVVSWGIAEYSQVLVDRCASDGPSLKPGLSRAEVTRRVSQARGTEVTSAASPATMLGLTGTHLQVSLPWLEIACENGPKEENVLMASWDGPTDPTVTVDVWVLEDGDRLLMLTKGVRGNPSPEMLIDLEKTLQTLRITPRD